MVDANLEILQAAAQETYGLDLNGAARAASGLNSDLNGICRGLWSKETNQCFEDILALVGNHGLLAGGSSSPGAATTPDHVSFAVTDLDVRVYIALNDWTPGANQSLALQSSIIVDHGWIFNVDAAGSLTLGWSTDGNPSGAPGRASTVATGFGAGTAHWVRATLDVNNDAAGHTVTFYTSDDGTSWTQLGAPVVTAGTTSIFNSTAAVSVSSTTGLSIAGRVYYTEIRNGIDGTIVANPDFRNLAPGTTSFPDSTGKTWTLQSNARIT